MTWTPNDIAPLSLGDEFAAAQAPWTNVYWGPVTSIHFEASAAESHSGTVVVTGGGNVVVSGVEGAKRDVVVTGAGTVVATEATQRLSTLSIGGGGTVTATGEAEEGATVLVTGGGTVTVTGFRTGGAVDTGGFFGRTYDHARYVEQHEGRVRVSGAGHLDVTGEKGAFGIIEITGGGRVRAHGWKRYPVQSQALLITALAA